MGATTSPTRERSHYFLRRQVALTDSSTGSSGRKGCGGGRRATRREQEPSIIPTETETSNPNEDPGKSAQENVTYLTDTGLNACLASSRLNGSATRAMTWWRVSRRTSAMVTQGLCMLLLLQVFLLHLVAIGLLSAVSLTLFVAHEQGRRTLVNTGCLCLSSVTKHRDVWLLACVKGWLRGVCSLSEQQL